MTRTIRRIIKTNGVQATVYASGVTYHDKILLQIVASKSWQNMERMIPSGGELMRGQYLLICPHYIHLKPADTIIMNERTFVVRRAEPIRYRNKVMFYWGLCVEGGVLEE